MLGPTVVELLLKINFSRQLMAEQGQHQTSLSLSLSLFEAVKEETWALKLSSVTKLKKDTSLDTIAAPIVFNFIYKEMHVNA